MNPWKEWELFRVFDSKEELKEDEEEFDYNFNFEMQLDEQGTSQMLRLAPI